ncbi:MAG: hypothetical protein WCK70_05035 [Chloroflexales bacterium]
MLLIDALLIQMISSRSLNRAPMVMWLCLLLMLGTFTYAGRRAPRKALAALGFALVCGVIAWSESLLH